MKKVAFLFTALLLAVVVSAQGTDFSGKWKLNSSKSKLNAEFSFAPKEVVIQQKGNDLSVEKHSSFQGNDFTVSDKFTLDGKECINEGWQGSKKKSTAVWSDGKKVLTITSKIPGPDGGDMTITEVFQMDGSNLIIESSASSSYGVLNETMAYDKQ
jgi:hypothetical protein